MSLINYERNNSITTQNSDKDVLNKSLGSDNSIELSIHLLLKEILKKNKSLPTYKIIVSKQRKQIFSLNKIPKISILEYLYRIINYIEIERTTLISALIYMNRVLSLDSFFLTEFNVHQILLMSIITSYKMNEDNVYGNDFMSEVAGISLKNFNKLEIEFLDLISYKLMIYEDEFLNYKELLENYCYSISNQSC
jgi:hypothetical protein